MSFNIFKRSYIKGNPLLKDNSQLTEQDLETVGAFKAIVAQRNKRPSLNAEVHKKLVQTKFEYG